MEFRILHESKGRVRIRVMQRRMTMRQADLLEYYLRSRREVKKVCVYERTRDAIIYYHSEKENLIKLLQSFVYADGEGLLPVETCRKLNREYEDRFFFLILRRIMLRICCPLPVRKMIALIKSAVYCRKGIFSLCRGRLCVETLDAAAVTISVLRKEYGTAGWIMFLLKLGEILEEWTYKKSVGDLAGLLSLRVEKAWKKIGETEVLVPLCEIQAGDQIVLRKGNLIPLDGTIESGECMVNQASITGEALPVCRGEGGYVYAGTAIEEGSAILRVDQTEGRGRYDRIVQMIEESEKLKSNTEKRALSLADRLVPYSFCAAAGILALTGNLQKAVGILMVDFSCALKLSTPLAVLSAMQEACAHDITVKGGCFLERMAEADTLVFDKTGTLTHAQPRVVKVVAFGERSEEEMLRLAACLEEHYPHPLADAVVAAAKERGLDHEECHSRVEYVAARGISSMTDHEKVVLGSHRFVFEEEKCRIPEEEISKFRELSGEDSHLYMAISGEIAAVICIEDPIRKEAADVIRQLKKSGIRRVVMMTGDQENRAAVIGKEAGIDQYYAEVLPEDKAGFVSRERENGHRVVMVGDGINDSPALSEADIGIAIASGAPIAREIADVIISSDSLVSLIVLRKLSEALMKRIRQNFGRIIGVNGMLMGLGVFGIFSPAASAFLHNISTLLIGLESMTNLLEEEGNML